MHVYLSNAMYKLTVHFPFRNFDRSFFGFPLLLLCSPVLGDADAASPPDVEFVSEDDVGAGGGEADDGEEVATAALELTLEGDTPCFFSAVADDELPTLAAPLLLPLLPTLLLPSPLPLLLLLLDAPAIFRANERFRDSSSVAALAERLSCRRASPLLLLLLLRCSILPAMLFTYRWNREDGWLCCLLP